MIYDHWYINVILTLFWYIFLIYNTLWYIMIITGDNLSIYQCPNQLVIYYWYIKWYSSISVIYFSNISFLWYIMIFFGDILVIYRLSLWYISDISISKYWYITRNITLKISNSDISLIYKISSLNLICLEKCFLFKWYIINISVLWYRYSQWGTIYRQNITDKYHNIIITKWYIGEIYCLSGQNVAYNEPFYSRGENIEFWGSVRVEGTKRC